MQQSQQPVSGTYVNRFGGASSSQVITNGNLFNSCMNAKGWALTAQPIATVSQPVQPPVNHIRVATELAGEGFKATCALEDVKPLLEKSPCTANLLTLEQMADTSKITPEQKAALSKFRTGNLPVSNALNASYRQHGGTKGAKVVATREKAQQLSEQNQLDLYEGKQTWGEYNKRRNEITKQQQQEYNAVISGK
jgi:hypothetical protein